jgi:type IV pilus assembly protein PilA
MGVSPFLQTATGLHICLMGVFVAITCAGESAMKRSSTRRDGFSLLELLIVVAIILLIAAIAIPNLLRARMQANEAAAVSTVRNINNSQATYLTQFSTVGFAASLKILGPSANCDSNGACLVDNVIGCAADPCNKSGYQFYMISAGAPIVNTYTVTATPIGWNTTGLRNICSFEDGILRQQLNPTDKLSSAIAKDVCGTPAQYVPVQ